MELKEEIIQMEQTQDFGYNEYKGEIRLWQAVVAQIAYDALTKKRGVDTEGKAGQMNAISMLEATRGVLKKDFEFICGLAGFPPDWVRERYRHIRDTIGYVPKGKKWRL